MIERGAEDLSHHRPNISAVNPGYPPELAKPVSLPSVFATTPSNTHSIGVRLGFGLGWVGIDVRMW